MELGTFLRAKHTLHPKTPNLNLQSCLLTRTNFGSLFVSP